MNKDLAMAAIAVAVVLLITGSAAFIHLLFPPPNIDLPTVNLTDIPRSSAVSIIVYSDFECPYCARAAQTLTQIQEMYGDHVTIQFKHYPAHSNSFQAAVASECARDQGMFWEYHDLLFETPAFDMRTLARHAEGLQMDMDSFNRCLISPDKQAIVQQDLAEARTLGISGTPTFFVQGRMVAGAQPLGTFRRLIDEALAQD